MLCYESSLKKQASRYRESDHELQGEVVLIHYYQKAIVAATLRYPHEVREPSHFAEQMDQPEAGEEELSMMTKIVDKMTKDLDLRMYHDGYKERIEALVTSKMKG